MEERSLKDLFHLVKKILPDEQELVTFPPEKPVKEALEVMRRYNFSQVPVLESNEVLGVFSFRSFAHGIAKYLEHEQDLLSLPVEEFLEELKFAQITDELKALLDEFEFKDAVLVGLRERLQGIITVSDALKYFYRIASPYFMLLEIELAIRALIQMSVNENELEEIIEEVLEKHYSESKRSIPKSIEEISLNDYVMILRFGKTWDKFKTAFGKNRNIVYAKLNDLPILRNVVFHFKREITSEEYDSLKDVRDWLLKRITKAEIRRKSKKND